jgi:hypothetical protein
MRNRGHANAITLLAWSFYRQNRDALANSASAIERTEPVVRSAILTRGQRRHPLDSLPFITTLLVEYPHTDSLAESRHLLNASDFSRGILWRGSLRFLLNLVIQFHKLWDV